MPRSQRTNAAHIEKLKSLIADTSGMLTCDGFNLSINWDPNGTGANFTLSVPEWD